MTSKSDIRSIIFFSAICQLISTASIATSFDCGKAQSFRERTVCSDALLSSLDEQLDAAYKSARASSTNPTELKDSQRAWMASANQCVDAACLAKAYQDRLSQLHVLGGTVLGSASPEVVKSAQVSATPAASPVANEASVPSRDSDTTNSAQTNFNNTPLQTSSPTASNDANTTKNKTPRAESAFKEGSDSETPWVLWLLVIGAIVGGLVWAIFKTNKYCEEKYGYKPFNLVITGVMVLAYAFFIGSLFALPAKTPLWAVPLAGHSNFYILLALAGISPIGCFAYLAKKTNLWITVFATVSQFVFAPFAFIALVIVLVARSANSSRGHVAATASKGSGGYHYEPQVTYMIQAMPKGAAKWQNARVGGGSIAVAVSGANDEKRNRPGVPIRVVEIKNGKEGSSVYSC